MGCRSWSDESSRPTSHVPGSRVRWPSRPRTGRPRARRRAGREVPPVAPRRAPLGVSTERRLVLVPFDELEHGRLLDVRRDTVADGPVFLPRACCDLSTQSDCLVVFVRVGRERRVDDDHCASSGDTRNRITSPAVRTGRPDGSRRRRLRGSDERSRRSNSIPARPPIAGQPMDSRRRPPEQRDARSTLDSPPCRRSRPGWTDGTVGDPVTRQPPVVDTSSTSTPVVESGRRVRFGSPRPRRLHRVAPSRASASSDPQSDIRCSDIRFTRSRCAGPRRCAAPRCRYPLSPVPNGRRDRDRAIRRRDHRVVGDRATDRARESAVANETGCGKLGLQQLSGSNYIRRTDTSRNDPGHVIRGRADHVEGNSTRSSISARRPVDTGNRRTRETDPHEVVILVGIVRSDPRDASPVDYRRTKRW